MKKFIFLSLLALLSAGAFAQTNNLILFTENGERFNAVLNGVNQNESPETNVRIEDLNANTYKLRVIFEDKNLGVMDKNVYFNTPGSELSLSIKQNKKGEYVLRMVSEVPIAQAPPAPATATIIHYNPNPQPVTQVTVVEQTTTTTTGTPVNGENVSMNVNMGGLGMNVNVNVNDGYTTGSSGTMSTTTTTTTTTSGSMNTNVTMTGTGIPDPGYTTTQEVVYVEGYNGAVGCPVPMSQGDYASAQNSIKSKSFSDSRMTVAKQIVNSNCLTATQVRGLMDLFDFEDSRLEFAKYAWHRTYDLNNYYKVNDAFEFESSIEELDEYISAQR